MTRLTIPTLVYITFCFSMPASAQDAGAQQKPDTGGETSTENGKRSLGDYLTYGIKGAVPFIDLAEEPLAQPVRQGRFLMSIVGPLAAPFGSYIWFPKVAYGNAPENDQSRLAFKLGLLATAMWWAPGLGLPCFIIPIIGWIPGIVVTILQEEFQRTVLPRAIDLAYSDAFGAGEGK